MKILEFMSFSPSWFLSLPGILITSGVVLLLVALIILLSSNKKDDLDTSDIGKNIQEQPEQFQQVNTEQVAVPSVPVQPEVVQTPSVVVPESMPAAPVQQPEPVVQPVQPVVETPVAQPTPQIEIFEPGQSVPTVQPLPNVGEVNPVQATPVVAPVVEPPVVDIPKPVEVQPAVSIYGGINPMTDVVKNNVEPTKPVIYGGADPLENTAPIPKVEVPQQPEVKVVEPVVHTTPLFAEANQQPTAVVDPSSINVQTKQASPVSNLFGPTPTAPANPAPIQTPVAPASSDIETLDF